MVCNTPRTTTMPKSANSKRNSNSKKPKEKLIKHAPVEDWRVKDVLKWARSEHFSEQMIFCFEKELINGLTLLTLTERDLHDFRYRLNYFLTFGEIKTAWISIYDLQELELPKTTNLTYNLNNFSNKGCHSNDQINCQCGCTYLQAMNGQMQQCTNGIAMSIPAEFSKTAISLGYSVLVTWITSFVMVIVHERVPDMERYPPLPDIFLDNVPLIPWAFIVTELTATLLFSIWAIVCVFHKYRTVLLRRFFALAGTIFMLRCCTMLITSLSVPGAHLECNRLDFAVDDEGLGLMKAAALRVARAYAIWSGLGMSLQGVRTCGDYMFSGHTVALTLMNFFITEYTPRKFYFLHTLTWLLNMFGIFFILASHEHYSIDVFVAFYITSRLFLYYHSLANNQALLSCDSSRTRIWFPMLSYFESSVNGIVPNEFESITTVAGYLFNGLTVIKDMFMLTAHRFWLHHTEGNRLKSSTSCYFNVSSSFQLSQSSLTRLHSKRKQQGQASYVTNYGGRNKSAINNEESRVTLVSSESPQTSSIHF